MERKISNAGIYWVDFSEIKKPEWGNTKEETPHLYIIIKTVSFDNEEMFMAFPLTSNEFYFEKYKDKGMIKTINYNNTRGYVLLNQMKVISKRRIQDIYRDKQTKKIITLTSIDLKEIKDSYLDFVSFWLNNAIKNKEDRKEKEKILKDIQNLNYTNEYLKQNLLVLDRLDLIEIISWTDLKIDDLNIRKKELINIIYKELKN